MENPTVEGLWGSVPGTICSLTTSPGGGAGSPDAPPGRSSGGASTKATLQIANTVHGAKRRRGSPVKKACSRSIARANRRMAKAQRGVTKKATRSPYRVVQRVEL